LAHPLGNVCMFYKQFTAAVDKLQQDLVAPVEKEFRVRIHKNCHVYLNIYLIICVLLLFLFVVVFY